MYPSIIDLATININGTNAITFLGEATATLTGFSVGGGNIFNNSYGAIVIGAPNAVSNKGRGYVLGGPILNYPGISGNIPLSSSSSYLSNFFTFDGLTSVESICASIVITDVDGDGVDDIVCGSYGGTNFGSVYWIRGGTNLRGINTFNLASLNGANGCRITNLFSTGDNCGYSTTVVKNMTGNGQNAFMIGCQSAFSNLGAVVVIPYSTNFCSGGTFTSTGLDGVKGTYYKGTVASGRLGYSVTAADIRFDGAQDLIMGSLSAGTYIKFGGTSILSAPPILVSGVDTIITGQLNDGSGAFVGRLGDITGIGKDSLGIGAYTASPWGISQAGRFDVLLANETFPRGAINLPNFLTGSNGFSVYNSIPGSQYGGGNGGLLSVNGDNTTDFFTTSIGAAPYGRTNAGVVTLCFGGNALSNNNNTAIYSNLINGKNCSEFRGGAAYESAGYPVSVSSVPDFDGDGLPEWVIGSSYYLQAANINPVRLIFGDAPPQFLSQPFFNIPKCGQVKLSLSNLNGFDKNDNNSLFVYNINVSNGNATLVNNSMLINNATYSQIANNQVLINRFCNNLPFAMQVGINVVKQNITKLAFLPPQPVTINFLPNVSFPLLNQNGNVRLTTANLDAGCDSNCGTTPSAFSFRVSGTGAFTALYPNLNTPVTTVSKLDLLAAAPAGVYLVSDGSSERPTLNVAATDNTTQLTSTALAQFVPFRSLPVLSKNSIFSAYNRTLPVTANALFASQKYNFTDVSNLIMSADCQNGGFYSYTQQSFISTFENLNITNNDIAFATSTNGAPKCNITITDQVLSNTFPVNFTYYPGPKFGTPNFNIRINQGVVNQTLNLNFGFQNLLNGINYVLNLFSPQHVAYTCYDSFGNPQPICTLDDVQQGRIVQSHDDSLSALNNGSASITDTTYDLKDRVPLIYTLVKKPQPVNFTFPTLYQTGAGSSIKITTDMLDSLCDAPCNTNASSLLYTFNVQHGSITNQFSVPITQATKQDELNGNLYLKATGNQKPILSFYVQDLANSLPYNPLLSGPFLANIPSFIDVPSALFTTWNMLEGVRFNLTRSLANGTSNYIPNSGDLVLDFNPSSLQNLAVVNTQTGPVTSLPLSALDGNQGYLVGGPGLPAGQVRVCYSTQCSAYQSIPVSASSFGFAPRLFGVNTKLGESQVLPFRLNSVNYTNLNGDTLDRTLSNYKLIPVANQQFLNFLSNDAQSSMLSSFFLGNMSTNYVNMQNGGQPSSCTFVLLDISRGLSSAPVQGIFTFAFLPKPNKNAFVVKQTNSAGNSLSFGTESLAVNQTRIPVNNVQVQFSTQSPCVIDSSQNPGSSVVPYSDLSNRYTRITTDGSSTPCNFNITFIDRSNNNISYSFPANVTYFDQPILQMSSAWNMLENVPFNLSLALLNATSNSIANVGGLNIFFQNLQNLQLVNYLAGSVGSYKLSDLSSNYAALIGGAGLPAATVTACNPGLCSPYQAIPVSASSFGFAPRLNSVNFALAEGQRQLLSLNAINFANLNIGDSTSSTLDSYRVDVSAKQFIEFYVAGTNTVLSSFTLADVRDNLIEVANLGQASSFEITLTDTSRNAPLGLSTSSIQVQPAFGYKPSVVNNTIIVNQTNSAATPAYFGTESLSANSLSTPVSSLNILFSQQPQCTIDSSRNPGSALVPYSDLQNRLTRAIVTDPNSPTPCQFNVSFIDPTANNVTYGPFAARVTFRDVPVVLATRIDCTQGTDQILLSTNFNAKDNANNASRIFVNWVSLSNAALTRQNANGSSTAITSYSLTDQAAGMIHFKPNAGAAVPVAVVRFVGSSGLPTQPITISQAANTLTFTVLHPAPVITLNQIITVRGTPVSITPQLVGVSIDDPTVSINDVMIIHVTTQYAWVQRANLPLNPNNAINQYTYGEESGGVSNILFVPDGSKNTPTLCVEAVTPDNISNLNGPQCAPSYLIIPQVTPQIVNNKINIGRDEELLITDEMLSGVSGFTQDTNPGDLNWEMNCQNAVLETNPTGTIIPVENNKFKSLNITHGNIRLKASDTNNAVTCTAKATNSDDTSTGAETTIVTFREKYYQPTMTAYTLPLEIGLSSYPILSSYIAAIDNAGNIGGRLFTLTQSSQMVFNISNMRGIQLPAAYDASNWAMIPATVLSTLSLTGAIPSEAAFNISACNLPMNCSDPVAAVFNWQPSRETPASGGGTSLSLIGGNATTYGITAAAVITGVGVLSRIFAPLLSRVLNSDNLERNPLVSETFGLIDKELRISNPSTCFYTSANKRGKFIRACDSLVNAMQARGIQTQCASSIKKNDALCNPCCSKDKAKSEADKAEKKPLFEFDRNGDQLLTSADVLNLSGIMFKHIKAICLPKKRSGCKKCCDLVCACQRDLEDQNILDKQTAIVDAVIAELQGFNGLYICASHKSKSNGKGQAEALLFSGAAVAAPSVDTKSEAPASREGSANSATFGADVKVANDGSRSPSGVLLLSGAAQRATDMSHVPGADATTIELTILADSGAADARGSRSTTPPPASGNSSVTATPPSGAELDPPPPPPMAAAL